MSVNIVQGNALAVPLADGCVQTVVTSPPYWGLRDYGVVGQLGLEPVPDCLGWATGAPCGECYVCHMVQVFREVRRVLRPDGTCWLNLGDSYANPGNGRNGEGETRNLSTAKFHGGKAHLEQRRTVGDFGDLKQKDLVGIPWRVAFALQADGWYLRSDIIWHKPNPMPESVTDRPTKAHEYVFLLAKSSKYYFDGDAIREPHAEPERGKAKKESSNPHTHPGFVQGATWVPAVREYNPAGRNRRTVWTIATAPYSGAHFATFPPKLVEPCILAGTSERGACPHCGAPWARQTESGLTAHDGATASAYAEGTTANRLALLRQAARARGEEYTSAKKTLGWTATCACPPHEPRPCLVFDPFSGSGTTGRVAVQHRRRFVGLELNRTYIGLSHERTGRVQVEMAL